MRSLKHYMLLFVALVSCFFLLSDKSKKNQCSHQAVVTLDALGRTGNLMSSYANVVAFRC